MPTLRTPALLAGLLACAAPGAAQSASVDWDFWAREKLTAVDPGEQAAAQFDPNLLQVRGCEPAPDGWGCPATYPVLSAEACRFAAVASHVTHVIAARDQGETRRVTTEVDCLRHLTRVTTGAGSMAVLLEQWEHAGAGRPPVARMDL